MDASHPWAMREPHSSATAKMCEWYVAHKGKDPAHDLSQYVSLALYLQGPPQFLPKVKEDEMPPDAALNYAAERADLALQLADRLSPLLVADQLDGIYRDLEKPLIPVLAAMERAGVRIDGVAFAGDGQQSRRIGLESLALDGLDAGREPAIGIGYRYPDGLGAQIQPDQRAARRPVRDGVDQR